MKLKKLLWVYFGCIQETLINSRYKETSKGKAETERVYWAERTAYTRRLSEG